MEGRSQPGSSEPPLPTSTLRGSFQKVRMDSGGSLQGLGACEGQLPSS